MYLNIAVVGTADSGKTTLIKTLLRELDLKGLADTVQIDSTKGMYKVEILSLYTGQD